MKRAFALKIPILAAALFLSGFAGLVAESFRVTRSFTARIDSSLMQEVSLLMGYNDGLAILFPEDSTFIKAIEIEIRSPDSVIKFPSSMAYAIYANISPPPDEGLIDFSGEKLAMEILPSKLAFALQVPLREGHGLKSNPYVEVLSEIQTAESFPIFLRLFPIMKGMPEDFETALFSVKIKPVFSDEGGLRLSIAFPEEDAPASLSVRIDEKPVLEPEKMQILAAGNHHLAVSASKYRTEVRAFTVERAEIAAITVEMKDTAPTVSFAAPSNVEIAFDGKIVADPNGTMKVEAGRHTVTFSVGDYSLQRQFTAEEGRDYSVSMTLDAEVVELR